MTPSDDDWLDALAGRGAQAEGRLLGQALREQASQAAQLPAVPPTAERVMAAAAAAGLDDKPGCRICAWLSALLRAPARPLFAAACAVALLVVVRSPEPPLEPAGSPWVLRGEAGVQVVQDARPLERRERLARQLEAMGVQVQRYERLGRAGLYARVDAPRLAALGDWLRAEGLRPPAEGELQVEVEVPR